MCPPDRAALLARCLELEAQLLQARQERDDWRSLALAQEKRNEEREASGSVHSSLLPPLCFDEAVALVTSSSSNGNEDGRV